MPTWTKLTLLCLAFHLIHLPLSAQIPINDDCAGIIDLGVAPYCPEIVLPGSEADVFSNTDATASDVGASNAPSCFSGGTTQRDVWFSFTTSDTIFDYTITVMGIEGVNGEAPITNPQIALYRGSCEVNGLAELLCASAEPGENMVVLTADGLTPNITYFIRINDFSATASPNSGSFKLCIDEKDPINLITDGGSTDCEGVLYDSGGPDGDYSNNENNAFTICPSQPNQCIRFTLSSYNIEYVADNGPFPNIPLTDLLLFYDGPTVDPNTLISNLGGYSQNDGNTVTANSGVCYEVFASSGCLTVQFISDGTSTFPGFEGAWECSTNACETPQPLTVDDTATEAEIESVLTSGQSQVTIVDINCAEEAYGTFFAGDDSDLGLESGIILSTGRAANAIGPNNEQGDIFDGDFFLDGDPDLDSLSVIGGNNLPSNDACVIELEVFANTNELSFEYVFGSEEYPEYVNENFNDIFAFLISGPGITGLPQLGNQENIAVLPNTNTFVEINSVNNLTNWEYYRNNEDGLSLQYDGLTSDFLGSKKSLTARRAVEPCNTYRLKLAIADRSDWVFDSGVFISEIEGGSPNVQIVFNSGVDYLIEDCADVPDEVLISLNNTSEQDLTYTVQISGTAMEGEDYLLDLPASLTFPPGENSFSFPITTLSDLDDMEGTETVIITLSSDFGCGTVELANLEVELRDQFLVDINAGQDTIQSCINDQVNLMASGAASYFWTPVSILDDPTSATPIASATASGWIYVEGQIGDQCTAVDSIYLEVIDPQLSIAADEIGICSGQTITLVAEHNGLEENVSWFPTEGLSTAQGGTTEASPTVTTVYTALLEIQDGCLATDNVIVSVEAFNPAQVISDVTICQNFGVTLATLSNPDVSSTTYSWEPSTGLDDPNSPTPTAFPDVTTTYELISTSNNMACADTSSVTVTVLPADVNILGPDSLRICLGTGIDLSATTNTGSAMGLSWSDSNGTFSAEDVSMISTVPGTTGTFYASFQTGNCLVMDSVFVQVDSLPAARDIIVEPFEDPFCQGDIVTLRSADYMLSDFPEIEHQWLAIGALSPDSLYNLVVGAVDTFTYQRITTNGACIAIDSVTINVVTNEGLAITPSQASICPGESVQLSVSTEDISTFNWDPPNDLSCTDCPNPVASPQQTTTYTVSSTVEGCAIEQSVTIEVLNPDAFNPIDDLTICADDVPIELNPGGTSNGVTYQWTGTDGFSSEAVNPAVSPASTTTYTGTATTACGSSTQSLTITVIENGSIISVANGADTIRVCQGESFELEAIISNSTAPSETTTWIYGGEAEIGTTGTFTATNSGLAVFNYQFGPTMADDCQMLSETVFVQVDPLPENIDLIEDQTVCSSEPQSFILNNNSGEPGVQYEWTSTSGFSSPEPDPEVTPTETTTYTLTASLGSCSVQESVTITVIPPATLEAGPDQVAEPDQSGDLQPVDLTATITPDQSADAIVWTFLSPSGTVIGNGASLQWVPSPADSLPAYAYVTLTTACETLIDSVFIQRLDYRMPNIFSPNNDGQNDIFKPFYLGSMDVVELRVYNRWGVLVFESNDPNNPGWDGMYQDKIAPSEVYIWEVRIGLDGNFRTETGQVTLIR